MVYVIYLVDFLTRAFTLLIIVKVLLSYFMSPFHPVRETIDRIVEPFLRPIRNLLPRTGMLDFSPVILVILVQVIGSILRSALITLL